MTKVRIFLALVVVLILAGLVFSTQRQVPLPAFPATVQRDCAPWDGSAFTIQIPLDRGDSLDISIWQSPDLSSPQTFLFPDETGQVGNALLMHTTGTPDVLSGTVSFTSVDQEHPVEGRFDLSTETGQHFEGQFQAMWQDLMILCG